MKGWIDYYQELNSFQLLPYEREDVWLLVKHSGNKVTEMVGYLRYGAGDVGSPYFVVPNNPYGSYITILAWRRDKKYKPNKYQKYMHKSRIGKNTYRLKNEEFKTWLDEYKLELNKNER